MCIIIYKPKKQPLPSREILERCFNYNSNGAGFMYVKDNKVIIKKGYMIFEDLFNDLRKIPRTQPLVMHFRIGTQGKNSKELTHPFDLFNSYNTDLIINTDIGVVHNGIISLKSCKSTIYSDTQIYIDNFLKKFYKIDKCFYLKDKWQEIIKETTNSKMLFLDSKGNVSMIGDFTEDNKIFYSNTTYKSYKNDSPSYNWDDYQDRYYPTKAQKNIYDYDKNFSLIYQEYNIFLDMLYLHRQDFTYTEFTKIYHDIDYIDYINFLQDNTMQPCDFTLKEYKSFILQGLNC